MNRVMLNFTPDFKPSRKSMIGVTTTTPGSASFSGSVSTRRRYSLAGDASISMSVNGTASETQTPNINGAAVAVGRGLHENLMMKILSNPVDQLLEADDSDSALSDVSFYSSSIETDMSPFTGEQLVESDVLLRCTTPPNALIDCQNNPRLARLYKDLQSPSATTRLRALRALKSPSKREAYGQFDVPHEEQDIITAEERAMSNCKTIQEIMAGVCIYVEVRSGADNRSDGIKDHVATLGAKVNEKLYKDTTHVIFKDGLLSTYLKAKKMNIPVVSILWIEACKRHMCLMNPDSFPISNKVRYENPGLFKKIRRPKSMQPRAEEAIGSGGKRRPPLKAANSIDSAISPPTKLPVLHRLRKDDGLEQILNEFQAENENTPEPQDDFDRLLAGPMRLLEKFRNSPVVASAEREKETEQATPEAPTRSIRKSLFDGSAEKETTPTGQNRRSTIASKDVSVTYHMTRQRRKTMLFTPRITSLEEENESPASVPKPVRNKRKTMSVSVAKENTSPRKTDTICSPKAMELCKANSENIRENIPPPGSQKVRNTIYSPSGMEQSSEKTEKTARIEVAATSRRTLCPSTSGNVNDSSVSHNTKTPELDDKDLEAFRTNRRRTLYTPGVYDQSDQQQKTSAQTSVITRRRTLFNPAANSTATTNSTPAANESSARRRRTLYTPSASMDVPETPDSSSSNSRRTTIFATPKPNTIPQRTLAPIGTPTSSAQKRNKTLLEEYQSSLTFSSTRTPVSERRKTIFDISMDIIDQRLSQINKQSKQPETSDGSKSEVGMSVLKSPPPRPSSVIRQTSMDSFYRKQSKSTEKTVKFKTSADLRETTATNPTTIISRKRKLFNAQPSIPETPPPSTDNGSQDSDPIALSENPTKHPKTVVSFTTPVLPKHRSLAPAPVTPKSAKTVSTAASRRSSMFFNPPIANKPVTARPVMGTQARTMKALGLGAGLPTASSQQVATQAKTAKPQFHLATTNLHAEQHAFVKEAVTKLGGFTVSNNVTDRTTHLVSLEPRRTVNILRALARGLWIVSYEWIRQSFETRRWLPEEQFEMRDFSTAVQQCRSERQAFGPRYRMELFADCGAFYVSEKCEVPYDQLRELIITCRGKISGDAQKAKYVIISSREDLPTVPAGGSFCVSPLWVLDSISNNRVKKVYRYLVRK
ncbi:mediator of DNA damage checkpoint protein 1 [Ochlerotatus camptorhynchus]|uniref:mediator of DNA damage checkpoint protein 1 n=1 Tax=Ochlerotatus camptorhynchus TaxID=644619 RepID=UPI0031DA9581